MAVTIRDKQSLKDHVYRVIYINQIPVFSLDLVEPDALLECGIDIGCKGLRLLDVLVELVHEGRLVAYHENWHCRAYDDLVFVSRSSWYRDLATLPESVQADLNLALERFDDEYLRGLKQFLFPSSQIYRPLTPRTCSAGLELRI